MARRAPSKHIPMPVTFLKPIATPEVHSTGNQSRMVTDLTVVGLHVDSGTNSALHLQMMDDVPEVNSWPSSASPNRTT